MKKIIIIAFIWVLFLTIVLAFLIQSCENEFNKAKKDIEVNIGKKIVIDKDTLLIIDYSIFENNYTLSNNNKISFELAKKSKLLN